MAESTVIYDPGQNQGNNMLPWAMMANGGFGGLGNAWPLLLMNGGGFGGFGGWGGAGLGGGILGFLLGALINNGNGFGGLFGGGNNNGAAAALGAQATAYNNTDLIMQAINGTDADVRLLATTLNADVNEVRSAISALQLGIQNVGATVGLSAQQIINSIQSGNADLARQLCECCCKTQQQIMAQGYENQLRTVEQTNTLGTAIAANGQRTVDAIADLKTTMVKEFCDVKERDMQSKIDTQADIITQLRNQADNAAQTQVFSQAFGILNQKITELAAKQPNTVPVQWPNIVAANATPQIGGAFGYGFGAGFNPYGYGFGGSSYWG